MRMLTLLHAEIGLQVSVFELICLIFVFFFLLLQRCFNFFNHIKFTAFLVLDFWHGWMKPYFQLLHKIRLLPKIRHFIIIIINRIGQADLITLIQLCNIKVILNNMFVIHKYREFRVEYGAHQEEVITKHWAKVLLLDFLQCLRQGNSLLAIWAYFELKCALILE